MKNNTNSQLQWVILLLIVAVVLPTICLLWFMTQAVKNERFAIKQKLTDYYTNKTQKIINEDLTQYWQKQITQFEAIINKTQTNDLTATLANNTTQFTSAILTNTENNILWPKYTTEKPTPPNTQLEDAQQAEFTEKNYTKAAEIYSAFIDSNTPSLSYDALQGRARCLKKAGKLTDAAKTYKKLAFPTDKDQINNNTTIANNRLMLLNLYRSLAHKDFFNQAQKQLNAIIKNQLPLSTETQYFYLTSLSRICEDAGIETTLQNYNKLTTLTKAVELALTTIESTPSLPNDIPKNRTFKATPNNTYAITINKNTIALIDNKTFSDHFQTIFQKITDQMISAELVTAEKKPAQQQTSFLISAGKLFPDLKIKIKFKDDVFSSAATQRQTFYLWLTILLITLMIAVASFTAKAILKQAKLNRLKNNFIATITHELKTPLASTRLLVDTLIDGNVKDKQTHDEYLTLISKENKRLTNLIDNFLTFSRMERNKQAFEMSPTSPASIAESSADAIKTKFNNGHKCDFTMQIEDNLPDIYADKDAMVTVLVNLLDNAHKYSYDKKQITLRVFKENNDICFAVKDNGIGMNKRQQKKIFDKFYQADNSLARKAQGTGLGLSIVKFIVDAHKGKIEVKSQPGKGSEFIVSLPKGL